MPQERKFSSNADRQRAYRERRRNAQGLSSVTPVTDAVTEESAPVTAQGVTLDEFLRRELAVTCAQIARGEIKSRDAKGNDLEPLRRCEECLRWRWHGVLAGVVASL